MLLLWSSTGLRGDAGVLGGGPTATYRSCTPPRADLPVDPSGDPDTLLVLMYLLVHHTTTASRMAKLFQKTETETEAQLIQLSARAEASLNAPRTPLGAGRASTALLA